MNKKLIAAAITVALAAPMAAQADVTVYGVASLSIDNLDAHDLYNGTDPVKRTTIDDVGGNTRLGVRWSEDLGGGLKALGEFEFAPAFADAATKTQTCTLKGATKGATCSVSEKSGVYARQTWVGLKGGFGQIEIGTVLQPYKYAGGVKYDAFVGTAAEARSGHGGMLSSAFGQGGYFSNALAYRNHFGSVDLALAYSPSDENDAAQTYAGSRGDLMFSVVAGFNGGEFGVAYAKNATAGDVTATTTQDGQVNTKLFGKYSFGGGFTVLAQWEKSTSNYSKQELNLEGIKIADLDLRKTSATSEYYDMDVKFLGLQYKMGMNTLALQYAQTELKDSGANKLKYMALGGVHNFSKKTSTYLAYRTTKMDNVVDDKAIGLGLVVKF